MLTLFFAFTLFVVERISIDLSISNNRLSLKWTVLLWTPLRKGKKWDKETYKYIFINKKIRKIIKMKMPNIPW